MPDEKQGLPDYIRYPLVLGVICLLSGGLLGWVYSLTKPGIDKSKARKVEAALKELVPGYASFTEQDVEGGVFYLVKDENGGVVAYGAKTACEGSYNTMNPIQLMTLMDAKLGRILGMRVVDSKETPGLGERIKSRPAAWSIAGKIAGEPDRKMVKLPAGEKVLRRVVSADDTGVVVLVDGKEVRIEGAAVTDDDFPATFQAQFTGVKSEDARLVKDGGSIDAISGATVSSTAVLKGVEAGIRLIRSQAH